MDIDSTTVADEAVKLIDKTISHLAAKFTETKQKDDPKSGLLFPNGIELIYLKFKVGTNVELTLAISGENAKYPSIFHTQTETDIALHDLEPVPK